MQDTLALQLFIASPMVAWTVVVHLTGLAWISGRDDGWSAGSRPGEPAGGASARGLRPRGAAHLGDLAVRAAVHFTGASSSFEHALFYSLTTYSSVGYDQAALPGHWRVLGGIEGVNGVLMLGWSTAFLVAAIERTRHAPDRELVDPSERMTGD